MAFYFLLYAKPIVFLFFPFWKICCDFSELISQLQRKQLLRLLLLFIIQEVFFFFNFHNTLNSVLASDLGGIIFYGGKILQNENSVDNNCCVVLVIFELRFCVVKNIETSLISYRKIGMQLKKIHRKFSFGINQKCLLHNHYVLKITLHNVNSLKKVREWYLLPRTLMPFDFAENPPSMRY